MKCRRCGAEIFYDEDGYVDERGLPYCQTYEGDPVAPMEHAPMLDYGSPAASRSET